MIAPPPPEVPHRIRRRLHEWQWLHRLWWMTHYGVGVLGAAAAAITVLGDKFPIPVVYVGIVAAVATSLVTFLGPLSKAQAYWVAFHTADQACLEFEEGLVKNRELTEAIRRARETLTLGTPVTAGSDSRQSLSAAASS